MASAPTKPAKRSGKKIWGNERETRRFLRSKQLQGSRLPVTLATQNPECAERARVLRRGTVVFPGMLALVQSIISFLACRIRGRESSFEVLEVTLIHEEMTYWTKVQ
jgi:hypothetical protein